METKEKNTRCSFKCWTRAAWMMNEVRESRDAWAKKQGFDTYAEYIRVNP